MHNKQQMPSGSVVAPATAQPFGPSAPGQAPLNTGISLNSQYMPGTENKKSSASVIETLILVLVAIVAAVFIGLYIHKYTQWDSVKTDVDGQIDAAVATAVAENTTKMEEEFAEREKYPFRTFAGPADYGSLTFEYPQTWSVYVSKNAASGGDFLAFFHPTEIDSTSGIYAMRVAIRNAAFESVVAGLETGHSKGETQLTTREIGGAVAHIYTGAIDRNLKGVVVIFKLRDKTVVFQTDSELFVDDFYKVLDTITFIP